MISYYCFIHFCEFFLNEELHRIRLLKYTIDKDMKIIRKYTIILKLSLIMIILIFLNNKFSFLLKTILKMNGKKGTLSKSSKVKSHKNYLPNDKVVNETKSLPEKIIMNIKRVHSDTNIVVNKKSKYLQHFETNRGEMGSAVRKNKESLEIDS